MADPGALRLPPSLVCVGNLTIDETVDPEGIRTISAGGDAIYAALAAQLARARARVLAPLGTDTPAALAEAVELSGTDLTLLPRRDAPTVRNLVSYAADGTRCWTLVSGHQHFEVMSVQPADLTADTLAADGILLSAMAIGAQLRLAAWLRPRTQAVIYFDPQEDYVAGNVDGLLAAVGACDVFLPSEVEARALAQTSDLEAAARTFLDLGPSVVVIKRAERGCLVATADGVTTVPADRVEAVDSTGAGDAFCGAFAAAQLAGADPVSAAETAVAVARLAVSAHGLAGLVSAVGQPADQGVVR